MILTIQKYAFFRGLRSLPNNVGGSLELDEFLSMVHNLVWWFIGFQRVRFQVALTICVCFVSHSICIPAHSRRLHHLELPWTSCNTSLSVKR